MLGDFRLGVENVGTEYLTFLLKVRVRVFVFLSFDSYHTMAANVACAIGPSVNSVPN
jgi:hypothetical protein